MPGLDPGDHLDLVIEKLHVWSAVFDKLSDPGDGLFHIAWVIAQAADAKGEPLPKVPVVYLGHGDVELVAHTGRD